MVNLNKIISDLPEEIWEEEIKDDLTPKQAEYLALLASGLTAPEIAEKCFVSYNTVRNTLAKARERVGAKSTSHLIATAVHKGWIKEKDGHFTN